MTCNHMGVLQTLLSGSYEWLYGILSSLLCSLGLYHILAACLAPKSHDVEDCTVCACQGAEGEGPEDQRTVKLTAAYMYSV